MTQTVDPTASMGSSDPDEHPVKIKMKGPGRAEILLHGVDIAPDLVGFQLTASPTDVPELVLLVGGRTSSGTDYEGMTRVVVGEQPDPGPAAAAFLAAIDAEALEKAALNRPDLDSERYGGTRAMLAQLIEWAQGR